MVIVLTLDGQAGGQFINAQELAFQGFGTEDWKEDPGQSRDFSDLMYGSFKRNEPDLRVDEVKDSTWYYGWDTNSSSWYHKEKDVYFYNSAQQQNRVIRYKWDSPDSNWKPATRTDIFYDLFGNVAHRERSNWSKDVSDWVFSSKSVYTYTNQNSLLLLEQYQWDLPNNIWVPGSRLENTYDENQNKILQLYSLWDPSLNQFVFEYKSTNEFNPESNEEWITDSEWNQELNLWIPKIKQIHSYDTEGKIVTLITGSWNQGLETWSFYRKVEYGYDAFDNLNLLTEYQWNSTSQAWDFPALTKIELTYDEYDRISSYISYNKDFGASFWIAGYQYTYVYDDNGQVKEYASLRWKENQQQWEGINRLVHFYGSGQVGTNEQIASTPKIAFFPNPASEIIYFTAPIPAHSWIEDMSGKIIKISNSQEQIDISHLPSGIYLLRVATGEGTSTHKMVKL